MVSDDNSEQTSHGLMLRLRTLEYMSRARQSKTAKVTAGSVGVAALAAVIVRRIKRRKK